MVGRDGQRRLSRLGKVIPMMRQKVAISVKTVGSINFLIAQPAIAAAAAFGRRAD
jgi:hypothetical protein